MTDTERRTVAVVGAGAIGRPVATQLVTAGHTVAVLDVSEQARAAARADGLTAHARAGQWLRPVEIVVGCLPGPPEIRAALFAAQEVAGTAGWGPEVYVEMATCGVEMVEETRAWCASRGTTYLAVPACGKPPAATLLAGGDPGMVERHRAFLEAIATTVLDLGTAADAMTMKILNQYALLATQTALVEAVEQMAARGWEPRRTAEVLTRCTVRGNVADMLLRRIAGIDRGAGSVALAHKDLTLVDAEVEAAGARRPVFLDPLLATFGATIAAGGAARPSWQAGSQR